ncbi:MAG: hypothetical protein RL068_865 [Actinomycetota bacterium]
MGRHGAVKRGRARALPTLGFFFAASLVMVSAVDPYSGTMASADTMQVFDGPSLESQELEIVPVEGEGYARGSFELLTGAGVAKLFVDGAPYPVPGTAKGIALELVTAKGWEYDQFSCLVKLWERESNWRWNALNKSSGAYGIPQSLPGTKMASAGADWRTNPETQIKWGIGYISGRYGNPCGALAHSNEHNWY